MAGKGRSEKLVIIKQYAAQLLVVRIGESLSGKDRADKAVLPGMDHFVIPVGPFDQPDGKRGPPFAAQGEKAVAVPAACFQVGLDHQAQMGSVDQISRSGWQATSAKSP